VQCPDCGELIKVGMGGKQNLVKQHKPRVSKACKRNLKKKDKANAHQKSQKGILSFFTKQPNVLISLTIPIPAPVIAYAMESVTGTLLSGSHATGNIPITASSEPNAHGVSICAALEGAGDLSVLPDMSKSDEIAIFSKSKDLHGSGASIHHPDITIMSDDDDLQSETQKVVDSLKNQQAPNAPTRRCPGYQLHFPQGQQADTSYPFALHTILPLPWDYSGRCDGFFLISHSCTGIVGRKDRCKQCDDLRSNEVIRKIVARFTNGIHENMTLVYHGISGLIDIIHRKTQAMDSLRLCRLNDLKSLVRKEGVIDLHKQLLLAISSQRIPCIDRVLHAGFRRGTRVHTILDLVKATTEGTYHPKGFDETEDLQALLFLCLGGARVADVAHHIFGTPATSTIRRRTIIPHIIASPSFPTLGEVESNIAASFKDICDILGASTQGMLHAVIMFDEISVEKRPHWDDKTNKVLGLCREHGQDTSLEFTSEEDLQMLWEEVQCSDIHLAHEVCVNVSGVLHVKHCLLFTSINKLTCHASGLIGNSWCDRGPKSCTTASQCTPYPYLQKL